MMWSAMNWLSQKAGINLDDAHEVLHGSDTSYSQADSDDEGLESSKENQSVTGNGAAAVATANGKRMRRSGRWGPPASISTSGNSSPQLGNSSASHLYHNGVSPHSLSTGATVHSPLPGAPLTPIVVPTGVSSGPYCMGSAGSPASVHPTVAPIMVPTGVRTPGVGYRGGSGLMSPSLGTVGSSSKLSPTSMQWKDASMAADINSPGFSFRIVRQAEKQADLGSRMYPTAQEKYLVTKHLPKVRLHGPSKPVMTPKKLKSVPLIQLPSSPKPPSLAPMLSNAPHTPGSASTLFSTASVPITDFRHADFFSTSIRSSAESHPVLSGLLDGTGSPVDHHSSNTSRVLDSSTTDVTSLSNSSITSMAVTAAICRSSSSVCSDPLQSRDEDSPDEDPTSLKAVLAALNKARPGKGVKRARLIDCDDPESKRPCSDDDVGLPDIPSNDASSSYATGGGGEKRALDTSSCSSLDNSQGSPCAKVARTSSDRPDESLCKTYASDSSAAPSLNLSPSAPRHAALGVGLGGGPHVLEPGDGSTEMPPKRRRVNPWIASFSSSRKMVARENETSLNGVDLEALDTDPDVSDKSSDDSDNSSCPEEDGEIKPQSSRASPAATVPHADKDLSDNAGFVRDDSYAVTPHIVTLAAHRSDKNMSHTRLNKMLGMLFHLSEDEVKSSTTEAAKGVTMSYAPTLTAADATSTASSTSTSLATSTNVLTGLTVPQTSGLSGIFSSGVGPSVSLDAPISSPSASSAASLSSAVPVTLKSIDSVSSATLPVATSSSETGSSVSASFTFKLPSKAQPNEKTASDSSSSAVVDGANPLLSFLAKNVSSSATNIQSSSTTTSDTSVNESSTLAPISTAPPAFSFSTSGSKDLSGVSNPLLTSFNASSSSEPKKSEGFSLLASSSTFTPASSSASSTNASQQSSISVPAPVSVASSDFTFGSGIGVSNASQLLSGVSSATNPTTSKSSLGAPVSTSTTSLLFSFGASSASTATSAPSASGTSVPVSSIGSSPAKQTGFQFGVGAASGGFGSCKPQDSSTSVSLGGFTFAGSAPTQSNDPKGPSSAGSHFTFGSSASIASKKDSSLEQSVPNCQASNGAPESTAASLFTFGNAATSTTIASSTSAIVSSISTGGFRFGHSGASFSTTSASTPATSVPATTSASTSSSASFTFGPATSSNEESNSRATIGNFPFTAKDNSGAPAAGNSSPFTFGSATSSTTAVSSTSSAVESLFSFGKSTTVTSESTMTSKPVSVSLFSFGPSNTSTTTASGFGTVTGGGFGAGTTSTAVATPQFGSTTATAPVFGSISGNPASSSIDKPATGGFSTFGTGSNLFSGVKSSASSDTGKNDSAEKPKTVTFGSSSVVSGGSSNLFGQTTTATNSNPTNLFGQAAHSASAGLFGKTVGTTPSFGSSAFGQPASAIADKSAAPSSATSPFQFGNSSNVNSGNATFTFGDGKNSSTFKSASGSAVQFGSSSGASTSTFGAAAAANPTPSFGSISSNPVPSFGSSNPNPPSFGSATSNPPPTFGTVTSNPPAFGSAVSNPTPSFGSGSSNPTPSFGSGNALPVPAFGSGTGSTPSFGSPAPGVPSFGSLAPSFSTPATNQSGMFQFSSPAATPQQQQQQQPNAFNAGHYALGNPMGPVGAGQDSHNLFSVGGGSSSSASRRPRVRALRRNR
ncbi:hypothetical protein FHG87_021300 [Trinorchestia longiramus]|nr:hypothetical protein FHG87_021300 [Trinorchestia longiramus]